MIVMNKAVFALLFLAIGSVAGALQLDAATKKQIDSHAFQFSGRHCKGNIEARFDSAMNLNRFKISALLTEEMLREAASRDPRILQKSEFNNKDLYRAYGLTPEGYKFIMLAHIDGKLYKYKCDLY